MIKAVIFDCFGVLVGKGFEYTYRLAGGDPAKDRDFIEEYLGRANWGNISDQEFRESMAQKVGISVDEWRAAVRQADQADAELLEYIKRLRPKYKTAILSNANKGVMERKIGEDRLKDYFDDVIVSAEIGMVKPEAEIYHYTTDRLGVEPHECVFIDDSEMHLEGARRVGMHTIPYQDLAQMKADLEKILADSKS